MQFIAVLISFLCVASALPLQACDVEGCSDESSLLMMRTSVATEAEVTNAGHTRRCAVCFVGELRNLNDTSAGLRRNILKPISSGGVKVDVFIASPKKGPFGIADFGLKYPGSPRGASVDASVDGIEIVDFRWKPEPSIDDFHKMLESAPKKAMELYRSKKFLLGPLFGEDRNDMRIYNHQDECREMIEQWETGHNMRYTFVMISRPDFNWLTPHPPLTLIKADMMWTFDTEAYIAMNDRHVVGGRDAMMRGLLPKMQLLKSGDPLLYNDMIIHGKRYGAAGDEMFSQFLANQLNIHVAQMPTLAYLSKCPSWSLKCTRWDGGLYGDEVNHAKSNMVQWQMPNPCWVQIAHDKINISHNCPPDVE